MLFLIWGQEPLPASIQAITEQIRTMVPQAQRVLHNHHFMTDLHKTKSATAETALGVPTLSKRLQDAITVIERLRVLIQRIEEHRTFADLETHRTYIAKKKSGDSEAIEAQMIQIYNEVARRKATKHEVDYFQQRFLTLSLKQIQELQPRLQARYQQAIIANQRTFMNDLIDTLKRNVEEPKYQILARAQFLKTRLGSGKYYLDPHTKAIQKFRIHDMGAGGRNNCLYAALSQDPALLERIWNDKKNDGLIQYVLRNPDVLQTPLIRRYVGDIRDLTEDYIREKLKMPSLKKKPLHDLNWVRQVIFNKIFSELHLALPLLDGKGEIVYRSIEGLMEDVVNLSHFYQQQEDIMAQDDQKKKIALAMLYMHLSGNQLDNQYAEFAAALYHHKPIYLMLNPPRDQNPIDPDYALSIANQFHFYHENFLHQDPIWVYFSGTLRGSEYVGGHYQALIPQDKPETIV